MPLQRTTRAAGRTNRHAGLQWGTPCPASPGRFHASFKRVRFRTRLDGAEAHTLCDGADLAHALCEAVAGDKAILLASDELRAVRLCLDEPVEKLCCALISLTSVLMQGVPFKLTIQAIRTLLLTVTRLQQQASTTANSLSTIAGRLGPLWASGLHHANREVRLSSLLLSD